MNKWCFGLKDINNGRPTNQHKSTRIKVHQICFEGGAELEAIANAALDSLAKDGIGCTAHLEHAMDKAATDACPKSKWSDMRKALRYFKENVGRMHYDKYIADGLFIGSGPVESGCKTVLGARLKQSGMFWSLKGAKGMIPLRTLEKSERLEEFFNYRIRHLRRVVSFAA